MAFVLVVTFLIAAWGWGRTLERRCLGGNDAGWAFAAALGLATWCALGGVLNLLGLAIPVTFALILASGIVLAATQLAAAARSGGTAAVMSLWLPSWREGQASRDTVLWELGPALAALMAGLFAALTLVPAGAVNLHDDLHTYLVRPIQMVQTGRLAVDALGMWGGDSLGAQAFLQGFFASWLPAQYLNAMDAVACFTIAGALSVEMVRRGGAHGLFAWLALAAVVLINPQYVNTSPLYSVAVATMALALACLRMVQPGSPVLWARALPVALFLNLLVVLKSTIVFPAAIFYAVFGLVLVTVRQHRRRALLETLLPVGLSLLAFLPWAAAHLGVYRTHRDLRIQGGGVPEEIGSGVLPSGDRMRFLLGGDLHYGDSYGEYNLTVLAILVAAVAGVWRLWPHRAGQPGGVAVLVAAGLGAAGTYLSFSLLFHPEHAIRYASPVLIGLAPVVAALAATPRAGARKSEALAWSGWAAGIGGLILAVALFGDTAITRAGWAVGQRHLLSFPNSRSPAYQQYMRWALGTEGRAWSRLLQDRTEAGAKVLTWTAVPIHMDFRRNPIVCVSELGLWNPLLMDLPSPPDGAFLLSRLRAEGVRYVIWQHEAAGIKPVSQLEPELRSPYAQNRKGAARYISLWHSLMDLMDSQDVRILYLGPGTIVAQIL